MIEHCKFMIIIIIPYYIDAFIISVLISILTGVSILTVVFILGVVYPKVVLTVVFILTVVSSFSDRHHSPHFNFHVIFISAYSAVRVKILCKHVWQK